MSRRICSASSAGRKPSMTISGALGIRTPERETEPASSCHFRRRQSTMRCYAPVRRIVYYGYSYRISGFRRVDRAWMPSTRHPEREALGVRALRCRRRLRPALAVVAALIIPALANAEGSSALVRATPAFSGAGDADSPFRRQLAQTHGELETQADQLFNQLLKDPKNVDLTLRYAEAAAKLGNYEAAISSLERLLLLDRN